MKKLLCVILCVLMLFSLGVCCLADDNGAISLLYELNIMKGDPDGNLRLDDYVSRAEFTKMAVASSEYRNSVATGLLVSPFSDVPYTHWAAPYIMAAMSNSLCTGYLDATFRPDNLVNLEEAVTIMLKVLGYTDESFGISWPYGQMGLANNLEITENVTANVGDFLTRRQVATLIYNTLNTNKKNSGTKLVSSFDCNLIEDVILIATNREDNTLGTGKVVTSNGTYYIKSDFDYSKVGRCGTAIIKNGDTLVSFVPSNQNVKEYTVSSTVGSDLVLNGDLLDFSDNLIVYYKSGKVSYENAVTQASKGDTFLVFSDERASLQYAMLKGSSSPEISVLDKFTVYSVVGNSIVTYKDGKTGELSLTDSTTAYNENQKTTYSAIKNIISLGDTVFVKYNQAGDIDYISYQKGEMKGPVTVMSLQTLADFDLNSSSVFMKNGSKVSKSEITLNDIVYYSKDLNMVLAYSKKITGIYQNASPNRDSLTSVTVSGTSYKIESVKAFNKLSSGGIFEYGDTVTLLLGKDGEVADVISPENTVLYGYLTGTGTDEFTDPDLNKYTSNYFTLVTPEGNSYKYASKSNYSNLKNSVVKVTFSDSLAYATSFSEQKNLYGTFNWNNRLLDSGNSESDHVLANNVNILDVSTTSSANAGLYTTVFPKRLDGVHLSSGNILFAGFNSQNEIDTLIVKNITGDMYSYGVLIDSNTTNSGMNVSGNYTYMVGSQQKSFATQGSAYNTGKNQGVQLEISPTGSVLGMTALAKTQGVAKNLSAALFETSTNIYKVSDTVSVYKRSFSDGYSLIPLTDLIENIDLYSVTGYYDTNSNGGSRIRVIVATVK